jgi:hypothetical protein
VFVVGKMKTCYIFGSFMILNVFLIKIRDKKAEPATKFGGKINLTNSNWRQIYDENKQLK